MISLDSGLFLWDQSQIGIRNFRIFIEHFYTVGTGTVLQSIPIPLVDRTVLLRKIILRLFEGQHIQPLKISYIKASNGFSQLKNVRQTDSCEQLFIIFLSMITVSASHKPHSDLQINSSNVLASVPIWTTEGHVEMPLQQIEIDAAPKTTPFERAFNPYDFNGG